MAETVPPIKPPSAFDQRLSEAMAEWNRQVAELARRLDGADEGLSAVAARRKQLEPAVETMKRLTGVLRKTIRPRPARRPQPPAGTKQGAGQ